MKQEISAYDIKKYILWAILIGLFIISVFIVRPFAIALISAFILAYLIKPIHNKLSLKINNKLSAVICILIIIGLIIIPLSLIIGSIISQINLSGNFNFGSFSEKYSALTFLDNLNIDSLKEFVLSYLLSLLTSTIAYLPYLLISLLIVLLGIYYILINWEYLSDHLESLLPFREKKRVRREISEITRNIVYGYLLIAFIEFLIASVGFYISGVQAFLLLAGLISLFAFVPGIGPGVVYVPTAIYYLINQNYPTFIGVLITGLVISILIETFLLGNIVGRKSNIHPFIFLLGVLGGVPIFGIFGFIIGPLILVYSIKIFEESIMSKDE